MKARVKKTGEIVELCDKQQEYFISTNFTPYKEEELEFGIFTKQKRQQDQDEEESESEGTPIMFSNLFTNPFEADPAVRIAIAYITHRKDLSTQMIENAVVSLMLKIKTLDSI